jgi:serine/threonine-protein kinase
MAPEQAQGRTLDVDAQSDIWSVGATLFRMLTGRPVHQGSTVVEQLEQAASKRAPRLQSIARDVPRALARVIDRALAMDKAERWPDALSMQRALIDVVDGERVGSRRKRGATATSSRTKWGVFALMLLGAAVWLLLDRSRSDAPTAASVPSATAATRFVEDPPERPRPVLVEPPAGPIAASALPVASTHPASIPLANQPAKAPSRDLRPRLPQAPATEDDDPFSTRH